jgi:hypothetical protein
MIHQLIPAFCGLIFSTQVNACSTALKQATVETNGLITKKVNQYKYEVENLETVKSFKNDYTATVFYLGTIAYKQEAVVNWGNVTVRVKQNSVTAGIRWRF